MFNPRLIKDWTKIRKVGGSLGVIISKVICDYVNLKEDEPVILTLDRKTGTITIRKAEMN